MAISDTGHHYLVIQTQLPKRTQGNCIRLLTASLCINRNDPT